MPDSSRSRSIKMPNMKLDDVGNYLDVHIYIPPYLPTYLPIYLPAYLPTFIPTYLPTYLLILSYIILSYLILSYLILSCLILSCLVLSYVILSYLISSYLVLSYLIIFSYLCVHLYVYVCMSVLPSVCLPFSVYMYIYISYSPNYGDYSKFGLGAQRLMRSFRLDFVVAGVGRCGTQSLLNNLYQRLGLRCKVWAPNSCMVCYGYIRISVWALKHSKQPLPAPCLGTLGSTYL